MSSIVQSEIDFDLPPGWESLPITAEAVRESFARLASDAGWPADLTQGTAAALSKEIIEATGRGLVYAAGYAEPPVGEVMGLAASLLVVVDPQPGLGGSIPFPIWQGALRLAEEDGSLRLLDKPEVVTVSGADGVKVVSYEELPPTDKVDGMNLVAATYYTSLPVDGRAVVLAFRTPCVWVAHEFIEVFDAIVASVRLPGSPQMEQRHW